MIPTTSASRAANVSIRLPPLATWIGGGGCCSGRDHGEGFPEGLDAVRGLG